MTKSLLSKRNVNPWKCEKRYFGAFAVVRSIDGVLRSVEIRQYQSRKS